MPGTSPDNNREIPKKTKKLISHFDMNVFPRVVWILSQLTAFVLKLQQKNLRGQKSIVR